VKALVSNRRTKQNVRKCGECKKQRVNAKAATTASKKLRRVLLKKSYKGIKLENGIGRSYKPDSRK